MSRRESPCCRRRTAAAAATTPEHGRRREIESGDGYVEFTVGEINTFWVAGLSHGNTDTSFGDIRLRIPLQRAGVAGRARKRRV